MMSSPRTPGWFSQKEKGLNSTGKLDLANERLVDLSIIGTRRSMKSLDLSFTSIASLAGLPPQPCLETINLVGSSLSSFENFMSIPNINSIKIKNTPVSRNPNATLSLAIVIGPKLVSVDGVLVSKKIKKQSESYPPIAKELINRGWIAESPCPSEQEFQYLCTEFSVGFDYSKSMPPQKAAQPYPPSVSDVEDNFEELTQYYTDAQQKMHAEFEARLEEAVATSQQAEAETNEVLSTPALSERLTSILESHGYSVDNERTEQSIVSIVSDIKGGNNSKEGN